MSKKTNAVVGSECNYSDEILNMEFFKIPMKQKIETYNNPVQGPVVDQKSKTLVPQMSLMERINNIKNKVLNIMITEERRKIRRDIFISQLEKSRNVESHDITPDLVEIPVQETFKEEGPMTTGMPKCFIANREMKKLMDGSIAFEATNRRPAYLYQGMIDDSGFIRNSYGYVRMDVDGRVDHALEYWCCGHRIVEGETIPNVVKGGYKSYRKGEKPPMFDGKFVNLKWVPVYKTAGSFKVSNGLVCPHCGKSIFDAIPVKRQVSKIMFEGKMEETMVGYPHHARTHLWSKQERESFNSYWTQYWFTMGRKFPTIYKAYVAEKAAYKDGKYKLGTFLKYCHKVKDYYINRIYNQKVYGLSDKQVRMYQSRLDNIYAYFDWSFSFSYNQDKNWIVKNLKNEEGVNIGTALQYNTSRINEEIGRSYVRTSKSIVHKEIFDLMHQEYEGMFVILPDIYVNHKADKDMDAKITELTGISLDASPKDALAKHLNSYSTTEKGFKGDSETSNKTFVASYDLSEDIVESTERAETFNEFYNILKKSTFMKELKQFVTEKSGQQTKTIRDIRKNINLLSDEDKKLVKTELLKEVEGMRDSALILANILAKN